MGRLCCLAALSVLAAIVVTGCPKVQPVAETPGAEQPAGPAAGTPEPAEAKPLAGQKLLFVVAPKDFRDEEYTIPHETLTEAGAEIEVASTEVGTATGVNGAEVEATLAARDATPDEFAAVVFVGGPGLMEYVDDPELTDLAQRFADADKVVAAICVAPAILAHAGILEGRRATVFEGERGTLESAGAKLADEDAVVDGRVVTAPGPDAAQAFADAIQATLSAIEASE